MDKKDNVVMDQVKKDRNPKEKMSIQDIIKQDAERSGYDFGQVYAALAKKINDGKTRILRHGNSILIYNIVAPQTADIHLATIGNFSVVNVVFMSVDRFLYKTQGFVGHNFALIINCDDVIAIA